MRRATIAKQLAPCLALVLSACGTLEPVDADDVAGLPSESPPEPLANPTTAARVELGRLLYWDPILSGDQDVACATCHHPAHDYADGRARSLGTGAVGLGPARERDGVRTELTLRNAPTVLHTAWNGLTATRIEAAEDAPMFWDNRSASLEAQVLGPLRAGAEMRGNTFSEDEILPELTRRLRSSEGYRTLFRSAFGEAEPDVAQAAAAIAAFERTLVVRDASFDRFMAGDTSALDLDQQRGLIAFFDAGCARCHSGPMLSDFALHDLGLPETDPATGHVRRAFRTPSLRQVTRTAPYMHDGSIATLEAVMDFYTGLDDSLDPALAGSRAVTAQARRDMIRFFESLSDGTFDRTIPDEVPSGLPVGGAIAPRQNM